MAVKHRWRRSLVPVTFGCVDHDTYYTLHNNELVGLEPSPHLPGEFADVLERRIDVFLDRPVLTVGAWRDEPARPDILVLDASGCLTSVLVIGPDDLVDLPSRVEGIETWLIPLRLRDLSDVNNNPASFYEGLWDLSPDASITLTAPHRTVIVTALDVIELPGRVTSGAHNIEIHYIDVFVALGGQAPILKRRTPTLADMARDETAIAAAAGLLDLTGGKGDHLPPVTEPVTASPINPSVLSPALLISPGATLSIARLPLLFDPLGANLTSISNELFAVDQHLVLVENLPERRSKSPFEDRDRFRWDSSVNGIRLLNNHAFDSEEQPRKIHLFVETDRQSGYCVYVGELGRIASDDQASQDTAWFSIEPTIDEDFYRLLRKGRLPRHIESATIDFGTLDA